MGKLVLTGKGRRWFQSGHPWIYADDIASGEGQRGELLPIFDPSDRPLGWGLFSSESKIAVRVVARGDKQPNREFWKGRIERAVKTRQDLGRLDPAGACRLLSGDSEGIPGLIVDLYADVAVLQCGTQAADRMRDFVVELLDECLPFPLRAVVDRSDASVRRLEGLESRTEVVRGELGGPVVVRDAGLEHAVDVLAGHKSGHYLDQRDNRIAAAERVRGRKVLDAFSYDGLFGIRAAMAGASDVLCLDQNADAGERVLENARRNGVEDRVRFEKVNVMKDLRDRVDGEERFGVVVLDPPAFARNRREVQGAVRGYRELHLRGMNLLDPGGHLVACSCSYAMDREGFMATLSEAARDAGREMWIEEVRGASPDHPVNLHLKESEYLKCAILRSA